MKSLTKYSYFFIFYLLAGIMNQAISSEKINYPRAKYNYQMFCQGCHTPDGSGGKDVPEIKGFIGNFLNIQEGREYLVRVPGSANSSLNSPQLAEVLNWIVLELGGKNIPQNMKFYTAKEVEELRQDPLFEVVNYRKQLVAKIESKKSTSKQSDQDSGVTNE